MDYDKLTKEELIRQIEHLKRLNDELLKEKEQETKLEYGWAGNLGHWYWDIKANKVKFNILKIKTLGYNEDEIPEEVSYQFFTEKLHPEDYQATMDAMLSHLYGKAPVYEVEYRIRTKDGNYKWYYDRGKITQYDPEGKPLFLAGIVFDITQKKELQTELENKNKFLAKLSSIDGLTKISNHRKLMEHLKEQIINYRTDKKPLSLAIFDIDDFKRVNDQKGHINGDKVLVSIAQIMQENIRNTDLAGRYGGEEFMVIFQGADAAAAYKVCERIRKAIEQNISIDGLKITVSGGLMEYGGQDIGQFIHNTDLKLYQAKQQGKNRIIY